MRIRVWELPVRLFHWGLAASCLIAWATGESTRWGALHVAAGAIAALLVLYRIGWGVIGERWSRWSSLGRRPGHGWGASISVIAAMIGVLSLAGSGLLVLGGEELRGPLAGWISIEYAVSIHTIHRALAWMGALWLAIHLLGVARESLGERQNLAWSMIDGRKRWDGEPVRARGVAALGLVGLIAAAIAFSARNSPSPPLVLAQSERWTGDCGECHLAFHPSLLTAASWERMLAEEEHFGEFLGLPLEEIEELIRFARQNSANQGQTEHAVRSAAEASSSLRITENQWWREAHHELPVDAFERREVGGKLRCGACHPDGEQGTFDGRAADLPSPTPAHTLSWRSP